MKICLNRYRTQVEIRELVECKLYEQAQYMQSLLAAPIYQLDLEMSDERQSCHGVIGLCWRTIFLNYVLDVCVSLLLHLYYANLIIDYEKHAYYS